ncbi:unnamed protein product [Ciceribacter sp. T2.26MG-112.2]|nr:unnamed protein product [Ciceribacter naphthalenivorans]
MATLGEFVARWGTVFNASLRNRGFRRFAQACQCLLASGLPSASE